MGRRIAGCMAVMALTLGVSGGALAAEPVGVGHSGWFWGNPLPQGNDLNAVAFAGARGYAVGGDGTVLRSDDGGATWTGLGSGTRATLGLVQTIGPNTVVVGGGCTARRSDDGGVTFRRVPFTTSEERCLAQASAISFSSPQVGYVLLANGTVLRTTDGGRTFGQRTGVPEAASDGATDIDFVTDDVGTAVAGGRVYRTVNGGNSWTAASTPGGGVRTVKFLTADTAVAIGANIGFLTSSDGGASFTAQPLAGPGAGKSFGGVTCVSTSTCLLTNGTSQVVRTTDGGATSTLVTASDQAVVAAAASVGGRVVGVGQLGTTVLSDDSGATFAPIGSRLPAIYGQLRSAYGGRAYALGPNGRYARTTDGGRSWTPFGVPTPGDLEDLSFPTPAQGFALDAGGALLRTDNGGDSWRILDPGVERASSIVAIDGRRLAVVGPTGVRRSVNGGDSFGSSRSKAVRGQKLFGADRAGGAIVVWGQKRVAISRNGGSTFTRVRTPRVKIDRVDFVSARRGFLTSDGGRLFATTSGGRRWRALTGVGGPVLEMSFADARRGFVRLARGGDLLRTDDGGRTWEPQIIPRGSLSVLASTAGGAFASSDAGLLFGTSTGGHLATPSRLAVKLSARRLRRAGTVRVRGKLTPASPGSTVSVILRRGTRYTRTTATVASTGAFSAAFRVKGTSEILAQWRGDDRLDGAGTAPVRVSVTKRRR